MNEEFINTLQNRAKKLGNKMEYWSGTKIDKLEENEVFVFGSNPLL